MNRTRENATLKQWLLTMEEFMVRNVIMKNELVLVEYYLSGFTVASSIKLLVEANPEFERMECP